MENIKLQQLIWSSIAVDTDKAREISKTILQKYNSSHSNIVIDFWDIKSIISEFIRSLLIPLINNKVNFTASNFSTEKSEEMYKRIVKELETLWTDNIKEIQL
jgi:6-pyruvoyl-tetrahydropterin synthase